MKNHVLFCLDASGSMASRRMQVVQQFNELVASVKKEAKKHNQKTSVSLILFGDRPEVVFFNADVSTLQQLTYGDYSPNGMTAMLDGVGVGIEMLENLKDIANPDTSVLVNVLTDGEENNSIKWKTVLASKMLELQRGGRWSFTWQVPSKQQADSLVNKFGVISDNVRVWENTEKGFAETSQVTTSALSGYYAARAAGKKQVDNFYVTADMSHVRPQDVKRKLDDVAYMFHVYDVPGETPIKEFVLKKTGKDYVIGSCYYQLSKGEKVQSNKDVLVMEKGKKEIWGGEEARKLVGLPLDRTARVTVGNLANYDVFIQSRSVNRLLVRGTKLLYNKFKTKHLTPSWGTLEDQLKS